MFTACVKYSAGAVLRGFGLSLVFFCVTTNILSASVPQVEQSDTVAELANAINELNARISNLEARISSFEGTKSTSSSSQHVLYTPGMHQAKEDAWRKYRWTDPSQWISIKEGILEDEVIAALGAPPRWVKSMKPGEDKVFFYEIGGRYNKTKIKGYVSFNKGIVVDFQKPNFSNLNSIPSQTDG